MKNNRWIKKGMPVVTISNLDIVMVVEDFIYKSGEVLQLDGTLARKNLLINIQCKYMDNAGTIVHERFHSKELLPAEIGKKGILEACAFVNKEGKYKDYNG